MLKRAAALGLLVLVAACSGGSDKAASTPASSTPSPTPVATKPGCTPLDDLSKTFLATGPKAGITGLTVSDGYVVKGPKAGLQTYILAAHVSAAGRPANEVGVWAAFTEQPGDANEALVLAVNPVAKALTSYEDSTKNDAGVKESSVGVAAALACLAP